MKHIFLIFNLFAVISIYSQVGFELEFSDPSIDEIPSNFICDNNGDFVGFINKGWNGGRLLKITSSGDTMSVPISKTDTLLSLGLIRNVASVDYNYLIIGAADKVGDPFVGSITIFMAIDSNLNIVWERIYKFDFEYGLTSGSIMQKKDSSFVLGCTPDYSHFMFLFQFSQNGDSMKLRTFDGDSSGLIIDMTYNSDSSNILLHTLYAYFSSSGPNAKAIALDDDFNQISVRDYPRWLDKPFTTILTPDGKILNGATYVESYNGIISPYIINDDSAFTIDYHNSLSNPDTNCYAADFHSVDYYYPGCYFVGGTINLAGTNNPSWYYISKLNDTLGVEYEKYIGGDMHYRLFNVTASNDGGVLLAGIKQELGTYPQRDAYLIKLDSTTCITDIKEDGKDILVKEAIVYPNPASKSLFIRTRLKDCRFDLYGLNGIMQFSLYTEKTVTYVDVSDMKSGTYVYRIYSQNRLIETGKLIIK